MYEEKQPWYFDFVRKDIAPLLPKQAPLVLEIGCGAGATLQWLKQTKVAQTTMGIELSNAAAQVASQRVDKIMEGPLEGWLPGIADNSVDLVLCLDVLEHLVDPWATMQELYRIVRPGGSVIVSLPNVRNHRVVLPLLFKGDWTYQDAGIMDRTHLRFFTEAGAKALACHGGFNLASHVSTGIRRGDKDYWRNALTLGLLSPLFVFQYVIRADKPLTAAQALPTRKEMAAQLPEMEHVC